MPSRTDDNQQDIVAALRAIGVSVTLLHAVGGGCPDLLCGYLDSDGNGRNILLEVKGLKGTLTPAQEKWHSEWNGQVAIVRSVEEAINVVRAGSNSSDMVLRPLL